MFINDIVKEIHSNIRLFADDTSLYIIVDFLDSAAQILNLDLERLYNWAVQWLVKFNPIKLKLNHYCSLEGLIYKIIQLSF